VTTASAPRVTFRTVAGVVVAIAVIDVVANVLTPEDAKVPVKLAIAFAFVAWARWSAGFSWEELGLGRAQARAGLKLGAIALLTIGVIIAVLVAVPGSRSYFDSHSVAADSAAQHVLQPVVFIPLGTVVFEELLFRGVLLAALLRVTTRWYAIGANAVLFGLWHIPPALNDASGRSAASAVGVVIGTIAATTFAGGVFAWLRVRSGSVIAPMLAHLATNSFAYAAALTVI
jgi:membrane protease YdiL (CAAX protease family)